MGWNPFQKENNARGEESKIPPIIRDYYYDKKIPSKVKDYLDENMNHILWERKESRWFLLGSVSITSFFIGLKVGRFQNPWKRFTSIQDIPSHYFSPTAPYLRGRVISVSDGDTIRFLHTPSTIFFPLSSSTLQKDEKLSDVTLPIRICTIDTPETAKFGKEGQPFGKEAKEYLSTMIENKIVYCQLLQKDQYGRGVAQVKFSTMPFLGLLNPYYYYVDERMLQAGLAEVYLGGGAVYGRKGKQVYLEMMEDAKVQKKGMWSLGEEGESPAAYKARQKALSKW